MSRGCVYGPVPSRRLGLSLGVDLVPFKVCCYDCLYCQVGRTSDLTVSRRSFLAPEQVAAEVRAALAGAGSAECVTLSGSGEPTLHEELARVAQALREVTRLPLVLLTNAGLLWDQDVAEAASLFDVVAPTLSAADPQTFAALHRHHPAIDHRRMLEGLRAFCTSYRGRCRIEVMLVRGINDSAEHLRALAALLATFDRAQIDLNTVVRPPAHAAAGLRPEELAAASRAFEEAGCRVEVIASPPPPPATGSGPVASLRQRLTETVARRPCTLEDLVTALRLPRAQILATLNEALADGELVTEPQGARLYYRTGTVPA